MTLVSADRVQETTQTMSGTGTLNLNGAATQCQSFVSGIGNGNTCFYALLDTNGIGWEVGQGTVTAGTPNTLSRDTVFESTNSGSKLVLSSGNHIIFCTAPANRIVNSLSLDNAFGTSQGQLLYRNSTVWTVLSPGSSGQYLQTAGASANPSWQTIPRALFVSDLSTIPTSASTGFTSWVNQGSAAFTNANAGLRVSCASNGGSDSWRLLSQTSPTPPYHVKALVALNSDNYTPYSSLGLGWSDGTKFHLLTLGIKNSTPSPLLQVLKYSDVHTFNAIDFPAGTPYSTCPNPSWLGLYDDATNVHFQLSADGEDFVDIFQVSKSSGYLGSSGYSNLVFGIDPYNAYTSAALMSYVKV